MQSTTKVRDSDGIVAVTRWNLTDGNLSPLASRPRTRTMRQTAVHLLLIRITIATSKQSIHSLA